MAVIRMSVHAARCAGLLGAVLAIGLAGPSAAGPADDYAPLPHLRPTMVPATPVPLTAVPGSAEDAATQIARPRVTVPFNPNSAFTAEQQTALANIDAVFNSFALMEGRFIQIGPDGTQSEGVFFIARPGRVRFHYSPPAHLDVIADGSSVAVKDAHAGTQDLYPLSKTPLRYLLASHVDLTSADLVNAVAEAPDLITVTIAQKSAFADGKLILIFDRKTYELRQWQVIDAQGLTTSVAIFDTITGKAQDPNLYRISINQ